MNRYPHSPTICAGCGKDTDGSITINERGICKECYKRFHLDEKFGFSIDELYGEENETVSEERDEDAQE